MLIYIFCLIITQLGLINNENVNFGDLEYITRSKVSELIHENDQILLVAVSDLCGVECTDKIQLFNDLKRESADMQMQVYAIKDVEYFQSVGIIQYPKVILYRFQRFVIHKDKISNFNSILNWINENRDKVTINLNDDNFEHDTQASTGMTTGDWFVLFHTNNCGTTRMIENEWEQAAARLKGEINFAYVNVDESLRVKERFHLFNSPNLIFFRRGQMYRYTIDRIDSDSLVSFSSGGWYKNVKAENIPKELTQFDFILEYINRELKNNNSNVWYAIYGVCGLIVLVISIGIFKMCCQKRNSFGNSRFKFD